MNNNQYKILYVDDERANLNAFKILFEDKYQVHIATSAEKGFEVMQEHDIKLVISDQKMPSIQGTTFLKILKQKWPDTVFILLTGFVNHDDLTVAINDIGIFQYIVKPFDPVHMELVINQALDSVRLKETLKRKSIELRLSEKKLSKIINSAMDAIITVDSSGKMIMTNNATAEMFQFDKKDMVNLNILDIIPSEKKELYSGYYQRFLQSDKATVKVGAQKIIYAQTATGRLIPIEGTLSKVIIDGDTFVNAILRNIEERVAMETELRESESQFRTLAESAPATILKIDRNYIVNFINKSSFNGTGYHKILGMRFLDLIQNETERVQEIIDHVFTSGEAVQFEIVLTDGLDKDVWFTITAGAIYRGGRVESVMLLCNDTSKLYLSQRVLRALTDVQNAFIDSHSIEEPFEEMLKILLSFTKSERGFIGEIINDNGEPDFRALAIKNDEGYSGQADFGQEEFHYVKRILENVSETGGARIIESGLDETNHTSLMGLPFYSKNEIIGVVGIAKADGKFEKGVIEMLQPILMTCSTLIRAYRDSQKKSKAEKETYKIKEEFTRNLEIKVSERTKELNEARIELASSLEKEKELSELKSRFVATASHEFRTPLSVIQSSLGALALQTEEMSDDFRVKFERSFDRVKNHIGRMTLLMDDVLIIGKLSAGSVGLMKQHVNLVDLCTQIVSNHEDIQMDGRKLDFVHEGDAYDVNIDPKLMEHAISNLVSNALKYSPEGDAPSLKLQFDLESVRIVVKDHGIGIPEKDLEHLFEPFYRASNVNDFAGTGLGSSIAKEYVELNGGKLEVESEVSVGSEFTIVLNNY